jgi:hypothetical protein
MKNRNQVEKCFFSVHSPSIPHGALGGYWFIRAPERSEPLNIELLYSKPLQGIKDHGLCTQTKTLPTPWCLQL